MSRASSDPPSLDPESLWALLDRAVAGVASAEERAALQRWAESDVHRAELFAALENPVTRQSLDGRVVDASRVDQLWQDAQQRMATPKGALRRFPALGRQTLRGTRLSSESAQVSKWSGIRTWVRAAVSFAASVVVLLATGTRLMPHAFSKLFSPDTPSVRTYRTALGQYATVQLGTRATVTLAPATTLRVTPDSMTVVGEVYVRAIPHAERSLVLRTANAIVQVLGTTFLVRQYPTDRESRVIVANGKVLFRMRSAAAIQNHQAILTAHMAGQLGDSGVTVTRGIAVDDYTAWTRGRLVFDQVPLGDVIVELARAYNAEIRLADTVLAHQPVTMAASVREESLAHVLDLLTQAIEARYTRQGAAFIITTGRRQGLTPLRPRNAQPVLQPETSYGR